MGSIYYGKVIVDGRPISRFEYLTLRSPEAIESVFYLYRITGDRILLDQAWNMFTAIREHTHTEIANAAIEDVTLTNPKHRDRMESFWLAETLKYFYLIFSDPSKVSLDEYVL